MFEPDETAVSEGDKDRRLLKKVLKFALSAEVREFTRFQVPSSQLGIRQDFFKMVREVRNGLYDLVSLAVQ
jgi:hypothetical protein